MRPGARRGVTERATCPQRGQDTASGEGPSERLHRVDFPGSFGRDDPAGAAGEPPWKSGFRPVSILDGLNERIERHRNHDFLNAALAASALATQAGGKITLSERYRIDGILARLDRLRMYDPHKVVRILDGFLAELRDNPEAARGVLLGKLRRIADDREAAELVVRIALSVCHSDGGFSASKRARFAEICAVLGYAPGCILGERRSGA